MGHPRLQETKKKEQSDRENKKEALGSWHHSAIDFSPNPPHAFELAHLPGSQPVPSSCRSLSRCRCLCVHSTCYVSGEDGTLDIYPLLSEWPAGRVSTVVRIHSI